MASRLKRAHVLRTAVAVAAVAAPLGAAGAAQAAIAGASPASTTNTPDLVSATALTSSSLQVCYDTTLASNSPLFTDPTSALYVSDYLSGTTINSGLTPYAGTISTSNSDCAIMSFAPQSGQVDLGSGTIVTSTKGAALGASNGFASVAADSVSLSSSTTNTGTAGHTAGPDLSSAKVSSSSTTTETSNTITYTFDQNVDPTNYTAGDFAFQYIVGSGPTTETEVATGAAVTAVSGETVTVDFPTTETTAGATVGYITPGAVYSAGNGAEDDEVTNPDGSYDINGASTVPSLVSAQLSSSLSGVNYTFDKPITGETVDDFGVALSDGAILSGGTVSAVSGDTVSVSYGTDLSEVAEYGVQGVVTGGAVTATGSNGTSTPGGAAIGGNAGLFARGYTTGPDVQSVVNQGGGVFEVILDQRVGTGDVNTDEITLLNSSGQAVDGGTEDDIEANYIPGALPGQQDVYLTFESDNPLDATGTQLEFATGAFETNLDDDTADYESVPQIVSFTGSGAHLKGVVKKHVAKKHVAKKHVAKKHVAKKHAVKKAVR